MPSGVPIVVLTGTVLGLVAVRIGAFRLMVGGCAFGVLRTYLPPIPGFRVAGQLIR